MKPCNMPGSRCTPRAEGQGSLRHAHGRGNRTTRALLGGDSCSRARPAAR
jgi:hypothetical protein